MSRVYGRQEKTMKVWVVLMAVCLFSSCKKGKYIHASHPMLKAKAIELCGPQHFSKLTIHAELGEGTVWCNDGTEKSVKMEPFSNQAGMVVTITHVCHDKEKGS